MEQNCRNLTDIPKQIIRDDGRYIATTYSVFSGIVFSFVEAHSHRIIDEDRKSSSNVLEIIYCREGRSEFNLNDEFVFLSSGDLMIVKANTVSHIMNFPIEHYHGLTVLIDLDETPHCLSCFLEGINVQPKSLAEKFCSSRIGYIARANPAIEHIFSEIYSVPEHIRKGYCKIKTLELMLFLSQLNIEGDELQERLHSRTQVLLAEKIAKYLFIL